MIPVGIVDEIQKKKQYLICLLPKSPLPQKGRVGPYYRQDWYKGCKKAVFLSQKYQAEVLVPSGFKIGGIKEAGYYETQLTVMGWLLEVGHIKTIEEGLETTEQVEIALKLARETNRKLIIISTFLHFPRILWLTKGKGVKHAVVFGIPRPKEAITDFILIFLFPLIDLMGLRGKFIEKLRGRRENLNKKNLKTGESTLPFFICFLKNRKKGIKPDFLIENYVKVRLDKSRQTLIIQISLLNSTLISGCPDKS